jgi:hypothetical protein
LTKSFGGISNLLMASSKNRHLQQQQSQDRLYISTISRENINDMQVTTLPIQIQMIKVTRRNIYKENKRNLIFL